MPGIVTQPIESASAAATIAAAAATAATSFAYNPNHADPPFPSPPDGDTLHEHEFHTVQVLIIISWGETWAPLPEWIRIGPGPGRPFTSIHEARLIATGEPISLARIPLEYHNCPFARELQRRGLLRAPWGPPPPREDLRWDVEEGDEGEEFS